MMRHRRRFPTSFLTHIDYESYGYIGFTDVVSNAVLLQDVSPLSNSLQICDGSLDMAFLPDFSHEAAHHACYDSPIGLALASLSQSSYSFFWEQLGTDIPKLPARDLAVLSSAKSLLQPLLEGLALFCEHDLVTGNSPINSRVTERTVRIFTLSRIFAELQRADITTGSEMSMEQMFSFGHSSVLKIARRSEAWVERKQHLLEQPLDGPERYLLGYLAVKGMYFELSKRCPALSDPELFFYLVTHHFMFDSELRSILLRTHPEEGNQLISFELVGRDLADFGNRFQDLFDELYAEPNKLARNAIEYCLENSTKDNNIHFEEILAEFRTIGTYNIAWPRLMHHRREFRFSFQPVIVRLKRDGTAIVIDPLEYTELVTTESVNGCRPTEWDPDLEYYEFEGSIEAVQLFDDLSTVVVILGHYGLVAVYDCKSDSWNQQSLVERLGDMPSGIAIEGSMHAFAEWQKRTGSLDSVREMLDFYSQQEIDAVDLLYPQIACHGWGARERERFVRAFKQNGIFSIFDSTDRELVARLSLAAGLSSPLLDAAEFMKTTPAELRKLANRLNDISVASCNFKIFLVGDKCISSLI